MAHIFKKKSKNQKGIIVFTHKEFLYFNGINPSWKKIIKSPRSSLNKVYNNLFGVKKRKRELLKLKENYYIGIHWGYHHTDVVSPHWVDFHMSLPGTCTFKGNPYVIPLSSASFTPKVMQKMKKEKYWDLICVAKNDHKKKYPELFNSIRKIFDLGKKYNVIFVVASNKHESSDTHYQDILNDYFNMFSADERERFTIIKTHPDTGFQGFSYTFLSHLYNQSKVFTIFSQKEGGCKVIKEAQLCGLPVVVKSDMHGGGRDFLNSNNSMTFDSYSDAHLTLIEAIEAYREFDIDYPSLEKNIGEESSLNKLNKYFDELYKLNNESFDFELINVDNLNRRLPAHYFDESISWASDTAFRFTTTDITNENMFFDFLKELRKTKD